MSQLQFGLHERKVLDLESQHPPGDKTIEEWLDEMQRSEYMKRSRVGNGRPTNFIGGSSNLE